MPSENISNPLESLESNPITDPIMTKVTVTMNCVPTTKFDVLNKGIFFFYKETLFIKSGATYATMLQEATDLKVKTGEIYYFMAGEAVTVADSVKIHVIVNGS